MPDPDVHGFQITGSLHSSAPRQPGPSMDASAIVQELKLSSLKQKLAVDTTDEVEDVVIGALPRGLVKGSLDGRTGTLSVEGAVPRDHHPSDLAETARRIAVWYCRLSRQLWAMAPGGLLQGGSGGVSHRAHRRGRRPHQPALTARVRDTGLRAQHLWCDGCRCSPRGDPPE